MSDFETEEIIEFLKAVRDTPKTAVSIDQVPLNLSPQRFDALSNHCDEIGYIRRTGGTLSSTVVFATITAAGREFISQHSR